MDGVLGAWEEAQSFSGLVNDASQRKQSIHPRFRLIRRPGNKSISRVVLEGCAYCLKNRMQERDNVIQALASVQMQKYGFEPFFG